MTKWFNYFEDRSWWTEEEFFDYFDKGSSDPFGTFLKTSYEMSVQNNEIWKVTAVVSDMKAAYRIVFNNGYDYPAGTEDCTCASELWNGFILRIQSPNKYIVK